MSWMRLSGPYDASVVIKQFKVCMFSPASPLLSSSFRLLQVFPGARYGAYFALVFKNASMTVFHWKKFLEFIGLKESSFWGFITPDFDISILKLEAIYGKANTAMYSFRSTVFCSWVLLCVGPWSQRCTPRDSMRWWSQGGYWPTRGWKGYSWKQKRTQ